MYRGTTCGTVVTTFTGKTSPFTDTTAIAGTKYQYWVKAINATCGNSPNSACASGTRLKAPTAPRAPAFTNIACATLTVSWAAVSGAASYDVYRKTGICGTGAVKINTSPVAGISFSDSGLTASTKYSYSVVAVNDCGSSSKGACASVTTTACKE